MSQELPLSLGSVQLRDVFPVQLSAKLNKHAQVTDEAPAAQINGPAFLGPADPAQESVVQVEMGASISFPSDTGPFEIAITIVGIFEQVEQIPHGLSLQEYLSQVAFSLLFPFLREQIYALSSQLRIGPILLPIVIPQAIPVPQSSPEPSAVQERPRPSRRQRPSSTPPQK